MLHLRRSRDIDAEPGKEIGGPLEHERPIDAAALSRLLPDEDILRDRQIEERRVRAPRQCRYGGSRAAKLQGDRLPVLQNPRRSSTDAPDDLTRCGSPAPFSPAARERGLQKAAS